MLRKEKYAYQPTYLSSLSEEKGGGAKVNGFEEDEEEEEDEDGEDVRGLDSVVCGNEKEPMLEGECQN